MCHYDVFHSVQFDTRYIYPCKKKIVGHNPNGKTKYLVAKFRIYIDQRRFFRILYRVLKFLFVNEKMLIQQIESN